MRPIVLIFSIITTFSILILAKGIVLGQEIDSLYYFPSPTDSNQIGVKTKNGKIILPAKFSKMPWNRFNTPITTPYIQMHPQKENQSQNRLSPLIPCREVYDLNGNFLYFIQLFDNGPDYFSEGYRRIIKNGKMGYANQEGRVAIKPQFEFAGLFNYGYAIVYTSGWEVEYFAGGEHSRLVPKNKTSSYYLINKKGEKVALLNKASSPLDYYYEGKYYPYPFHYSAKEKRLRDSINELPILQAVTHHYTGSKIKNSVHWEITGRPSPNFKFYTFSGFATDNWKERRLTLIVNLKGEIFRVHDEDCILDQIPLEKWLRAEIFSKIRRPSSLYFLGLR